MATRSLFSVFGFSIQPVDMAAKNNFERRNKNQKPTTKRFVLITNSDVEKFLEAEKNKTIRRKARRDVVLVMAFRVA